MIVWIAQRLRRQLRGVQLEVRSQQLRVLLYRGLAVDAWIPQHTCSLRALSEEVALLNYPCVSMRFVRLLTDDSAFRVTLWTEDLHSIATERAYADLIAPLRLRKRLFECALQVDAPNLTLTIRRFDPDKVRHRVMRIVEIGGHSVLHEPTDLQRPLSRTRPLVDAFVSPGVHTLVVRR
nr:hypothetical protein [uncultured Steroidobacter sp.]